MAPAPDKCKRGRPTKYKSVEDLAEAKRARQMKNREAVRRHRNQQQQNQQQQNQVVEQSNGEGSSANIGLEIPAIISVHDAIPISTPLAIAETLIVDDYSTEVGIILLDFAVVDSAVVDSDDGEQPLYFSFVGHV
ncbi:hypothetical protein L211DRAFT_845706 [Terfezia boudieri ATCC MYA-4762]|uniref:BZIP domain-containing protein n=1 Tax=Terfezia boudieri ATCC MYA-4762 TaxID=1051890 RepID=A0A3N4M0J2_9PEZI|nr:hypothetical protein L211DRAFT_845706 [Terfezia boudieri ATCC MYA-4762]